MRIGLFASSFYPHCGGVEEVCRQFAKQVKSADHDVRVLTNRWPRSLMEYEVVQGIEVHRLAMRVPADGVKAKVTFALTSGLVKRRMFSLLREFQPDVLHVHCVSSNAAYALEAQRILRLPLVLTLHGELTMDSTQLFQRAAWAQRVMRQSLECADAITACSRQTLHEAETWFGESFGERGRVIHNGISLEESRTARPFMHFRPYILAIGRHVPQKGFDLLLKAMAKLLKEGLSHDLVLAGDGTEHANLKALANELGLSAHVKFTGRVDHSEAVSLFAGCSFFVLPSRHEPFGIVNLEAMAAGKAVVATRVGGVSEVVRDGETGLLINPEDANALAAVISRLMADEPLRRSLGEAGQKRAQQFAWSSIATEYIAVYDQVCEKTMATGSVPCTI